MTLQYINKYSEFCIDNLLNCNNSPTIYDLYRDDLSKNYKEKYMTFIFDNRLRECELSEINKSFRNIEYSRLSPNWPRKFYCIHAFSTSNIDNKIHQIVVENTCYFPTSKKISERSKTIKILKKMSDNNNYRDSFQFQFECKITGSRSPINFYRIEGRVFKQFDPIKLSIYFGKNLTYEKKPPRPTPFVLRLKRIENYTFLLINKKNLCPFTSYKTESKNFKKSIRYLLNSLQTIYRDFCFQEDVHIYYDYGSTEINPDYDFLQKKFGFIRSINLNKKKIEYNQDINDFPIAKEEGHSLLRLGEIRQISEPNMYFGPLFNYQSAALTKIPTKKANPNM